MSKPGSVPTWATNTNYASGPASGTPTKVAPSAGDVQEGYEPAQEPGAQKFNYQLNLIGQWLTWLNGALTPLGQQVLTSASGTYTPTTGTLAVKVKMVGGGGGGGGASANSANFMAGGGGASGVYWEKWINPGALITGGAFACGAAGAAGVGSGGGTNGGNGGDTSIVVQGVTYTAKGGFGGGTFVGGGGTFITGGAGTVQTGSSAGDVASGENGGSMIVAGSNGALGGAGGGGRWGAGGAPAQSFGNAHGLAGTAGTGDGAGGGGAFTDTTGGDRNGGAGTAGKIIVEELG